MNQTHLFPSIIIEEKTYEIDNEKISKVILIRLPFFKKKTNHD